MKKKITILTLLAIQAMATIAQRTHVDYLMSKSDSTYSLNINSLQDSLVTNNSDSTWNQECVIFRANTLSEYLNENEINHNYKVGEIKYTTSVSEGGSACIDIPFEFYANPAGQTPNISLAYNSMSGTSPYGFGWTLNGLSIISKTKKIDYYDGITNAPSLYGLDDAFLLDGVRLIEIGRDNDTIRYETETGKVKAFAYINDEGLIDSFKVLYPDGSKSSYDITDGLNYYITTNRNLYGDIVNYSWQRKTGHYRPHHITYGKNGDARISFNYTDITENIPTYFYAGNKKIYDYLLSNIVLSIVQDGTTTSKTYTPQYELGPTNQYQLVSMDCRRGRIHINPISIEYDQINLNRNLSINNYNAPQWLSLNNTDNGIILIRGIYDHNTNSEYCITFPNKNPFVEVENNGNLEYYNTYTSSDLLIATTGIGEGEIHSFPMYLYSTFTDAFTLDVDNDMNDEVVLVSHQKRDSQTFISIDIYKLQEDGFQFFNRLSTTIGYDSATNQRISHPFSIYSGCFTGNGKSELMIVESHNRSLSGNTKIQIIDVATAHTIYSNSDFNFGVSYIRENYTYNDVINADANSDKLFVCDIDGDGKTDIVHINENGLRRYKLDKYGNTYSMSYGLNQYAITTDTLMYRALLCGDFNNDGLIDFAATPDVGHTDWKLAYSKGDGTFEIENKYLGYRARDSHYYSQDINLDGFTDIVCLNDCSASVNMLSYDNSLGSISISLDDNFIICPINQFHYGRINSLMTIDSTGRISLWYMDANDYKNSLIKKLISSHGVHTSFAYTSAFNNNDYYNGYHFEGNEPPFPYQRYEGLLNICCGTETSWGDSVYVHKGYDFYNAIIDRSGRGLIGFTKIKCTDYLTGGQTTSNYNPYYNNILTIYEDNLSKDYYTYQNSIADNKICENKLLVLAHRDKLAQTTVLTNYSYDTMGNVTSEIVTYADNTSQSTATTYQIIDNNDVYVSLPLTQIVSTKRSNGSDSNLTEYTYGENYRVVAVQSSNPRSETINTYDSSGYLTKQESKVYDSTNYQTTNYTYNTRGDILSKRDPLGNYEYYRYSTDGTINRIQNSSGQTNITHELWDNDIFTLLPDGSRDTIMVRWTDNGESIYKTIQKKTGQPTTIKYYNPLGQEIRSQYIAFNGDTISIDRKYNSRGQVAMESRPYKVTPSVWTTYEYDEYGRPTIVHRPLQSDVVYSYDGLSTTVSYDGTTKRIEKNFLGEVVNVTDGEGTTTYNYNPSGTINNITTIDGITTSFQYDADNRRIRVEDPSSGTITTTYDNAGNVASTTNANGETITYTYDSKNRLISKNIYGLFSVTYSYYSGNLLSRIEASNGWNKRFLYDTHKRLSSEIEYGLDGHWFKKEYHYADGNISSISYTSQDGYITTENYIFEKGSLYKVYLPCEDSSSYTGNNINNRLSVYTKKTENDQGIVSSYDSGCITYSKVYDSIGRLTQINEWTFVQTVQRDSLPIFPFLPHSESVQTVNSSIITPGLITTDGNRIYTFNNITGNISRRRNGNLVQNYAYDSMNRLVDNNGESITYDSKGNILSMSRSGSFGYSEAKPYAIESFTPSSDQDTPPEQYVSYNALNRVSEITQENYFASFDYDYEGNRIRMEMLHNDTVYKTKYYFSDKYEVIETPSGTKEILYIGGDAYTALVALVKTNNTWEKFYLDRDLLGSIEIIRDSVGRIIQNLRFDAWGRILSPTGAYYTNNNQPNLLLERGFTGHEHLNEFGIINMNARLYDPMIGRFMSPDPMIQDPSDSQNFNRYSYCMNNPMKGIDRDGELVWFIPVIAGAIIGSYVGASLQSNNFAFWKWSSKAWKGAIIGGIVGGTIGYGVSSILASSTNSCITGLLNNIPTPIINKTAGITGAILQSGSTNIAINTLFGGDINSNWKTGIAGLITGAWGITGGLGMAKAFGANSDIWKIAGKLGYQMIGTVGQSIGSNWSLNKGLFSSITLGIGPVNLTLDKNKSILQLGNNIGNILANSMGIINMFFGGKATFDVENLTMVYAGGLRDNWFSGDTATGTNVLFMNNESYKNSLCDTYRHELNHLWQSRAMGDTFIPNYISNGIIAYMMGGSFVDYFNFYEQIAYFHEWY